MRREFEKWAKGRGLSLEVTLGCYASPTTANCWEVWQASYEAAFRECASIMGRCVDEKWMGHPSAIILGSLQIDHEQTENLGQATHPIGSISGDGA